MHNVQQTRSARITDRLDELAYRVRRLMPSHRDPERYHVEKSEIEHELRRLAREAGSM